MNSTTAQDTQTLDLLADLDPLPIAQAAAIQYQPTELWEGYAVPAANNPVLGVYENLFADRCRVVKNPDQWNGSNLDGWIAIPLADAHNQMTGLAFLPPKPQRKMEFFPHRSHPVGGYVVLSPQQGQTVYVVEKLQDAGAIARAGLPAVASLARGNLEYVARAWLKAGHSVVSPVYFADADEISDLLKDGKAKVLALEDAICNHEPDELVIALTATATMHAAHPTAWLDPLPLREPDEAAPYPLAALPVELQALANEIQGYYKAPMPMIATCGLAILSAAGQAVADVNLDGTLKSPLSLFGLIIADSGERKSAIEKVFSAPLQEWQKQQRESMADAIHDAKANKAIWYAKKKGIESAIERMASKGEDCSAKEDELRELERTPPPVVRMPKMIVENITAEGLMKSLMTYPTAIVLSSEGGMFLGSHGMKADSSTNTMATINKLWDGDSLDNTRASSENERELYHRRLSVGLSVQPSVLADFAKGNSARGIGFFARFLMTYPTSTKGTRLYTEPPVWSNLALWRERITALLNIEPQINEDGSLDLKTITPNSDAMNVWIAGHNAIESELGAYGEFCDVDDVASKAANNAARIAALLHLYRHGLEGRITAEEMHSGMILAVWYLNEAKRYFNQSTLDQSTTDAEKLEGWMVKYCLEHGVNSIPLRTAYQLCQPKAARGKKALLEALQPLIEHHRARIEKQGNADHVAVNPCFLNANNGATRATGATT